MTSPASAKTSRDKQCRLKGRVYIRHIQAITNTSSGDDLSLTISMSDESLDEFVMIFPDLARLLTWKSTIEDLVLGQYASDDNKHDSTSTTTVTQLQLKRYLPDDVKSTHSHGSGSSHGQSSKISHYTPRRAEIATAIPEHSPVESFNDPAYSPTFAFDASSRHKDYTSLDLMIVLSVPPAGTSMLKLDIIKSTLDFIVGTAGPRTRLSIVTYTAGEGTRGMLRKTPLIALGRPDAKARLDKIIGEVGREDGEAISMIEHREERVNVVTAVNLALDVVLQRSVRAFSSRAVIAS